MYYTLSCLSPVRCFVWNRERLVETSSLIVVYSYGARDDIRPTSFVDLWLLAIFARGYNVLGLLIIDAAYEEQLFCEAAGGKSQTAWARMLRAEGIRKPWSDEANFFRGAGHELKYKICPRTTAHLKPLGNGFDWYVSCYFGLACASMDDITSLLCMRCVCGDGLRLKRKNKYFPDYGLQSSVTPEVCASRYAESDSR